MKRKCLSVILSFCILMGSAVADVGDISVSGAQMEQGETVAETEKEGISGNGLDEVETLETESLESESTEVQKTVETEDVEPEGTERQQNEEIELKEVVETEISGEDSVEDEVLQGEEDIKEAEESLQSGDFTYRILDDGTVEITKYNGSDAEVTLPSEIDGKSVTGIGKKAFYNCSTLSNVLLPNSITIIDDFAFYNCSALSNIVLPDKLTTIGDETFSGCSQITEIVLPNSIKEIGRLAFKGSQITYVKIPASVESLHTYGPVNESAFTGCNRLETIEFEKGIETIPGKLYPLSRTNFLTPWV